MEMKLSVIIPCFNGEETIAGQLEALCRQSWSGAWEVIVADNGSTDQSMAIVKRFLKEMPNLRITDASGRLGQPYALNAGVRAARGESVAFCDADDEVAPGWLAAMGEALSVHDFVACRTDIGKLNPGWTVKSRRNIQAVKVPVYDNPPFLNHAGGGTLGVKKSLHEAVGGFDESFPLLHDTDFCWKLQLLGVQLHFVPDAVTHIRFRNTLTGIYRQARGYGEYNVRIYKKYLDFGMPGISRISGIMAWIYLRKHLFRIRDKGDLANFMWQVGYRTGRLRGSIKCGVFAL